MRFPGGSTALHLAAKSGSHEVCECLLAAHAFVTLGDDAEDTALHIAARACNHSVTALLLRARASPEMGNLEGKTAHRIAEDANFRAFETIVRAAHADQEKAKVGGARKPLCMPANPLPGLLRQGCFTRTPTT